MTIKYLQGGPMTFAHGNKAYRDNYERMFGKRPVESDSPTYPRWLAECPDCGTAVDRNLHASDLHGMMRNHGVVPPAAHTEPVAHATQGLAPQPTLRSCWRCPQCGKRLWDLKFEIHEQAETV